MKIATLPHLRVRGWDGRGPFNDCGFVTLEDLEEFSAPRSTDAMSVAYLVPGEESFPRLNAAALPALIEADQEPLLHWVFLDIDNPGHARWSNMADATMALVFASGWTGMGGYTTRAGYRLVAPLDPPLPVSLANSFLSQFGAHLQTMPGTKGDLDIDPASYEWTRLMRLPKAKRDGVVIDSVTLLDSLTPINPHAFGFTLTAQSHEVGDWGDAPPEPVPLAWEDWQHASDMTWARQGRPVPPDAHGSSYGNCKTSLARIAARGKVDDPHTLASYLWESVLATSGSSLDIGELWKLACWVADRQASDVEDVAVHIDGLPAPGMEDSEWLLVRRALSGRMSPYYGKLRDGQPLSPRGTQLEPKTYGLLRHLVEDTDHPADFYYRAVHASVTTQKKPLLPEVWDKCQAMVLERETSGDSDARLRKAFVGSNPLTLACPAPGTPLFQLDTSTTPYSYLTTSENLIELDFERLTKPGLPFEADYAGLSVRNIMRDYGGRVDTIAYASGQSGCRYNSEHSVMHVGTHQLAQVKAKYHEDVAEWLRLIGGTDPEGLLDWLACVTYTVDQPLCAMYIKGAPGIGKSLLGKGISALWNGPPADYNRAMSGEFNSAMLMSPVLFADEGVVVDRNNQATASLKFRDVVSSTSHTIRALYKAPVNLRGAMRVLVCANDENGLPFKESLGADGIEAIVQRVMYIEADPAAATYLQALGGREGIGDRWAPPTNEPGAIAEHLIWLRDNRKVQPQEGSRFMVAGKPTHWHREFGARQGIKPNTLQVVYALLQRARAGAAGDPGIYNDEEEEVVWVRARTVLDAWDTLSRSFRAKPAAIKDSLKQLAGGASQMKRLGGTPMRVYGIPWTAFVDGAVCETEDLE